MSGLSEKRLGLARKQRLRQGTRAQKIKCGRQEKGGRPANPLKALATRVLFAVMVPGSFILVLVMTGCRPLSMGGMHRPRHPCVWDVVCNNGPGKARQGLMKCMETASLGKAVEKQNPNHHQREEGIAARTIGAL